MNKLFVIAVTLVLAISLAGCGGGSKTASQATQDKAETQPAAKNDGSDKKANLTTVKGFLAAYGLTEDDLKCANFTRLDKTAFIVSDGPNKGEIKEVGAYISKALTDGEAKAWFEKIINKLNSLSDDGKIENFHAKANGEALTVDFIMNNPPFAGMYNGGGWYNYNGKKVGVTFAVMQRSLDNEDPDEAMPACTLGLEYL